VVIVLFKAVFFAYTRMSVSDFPLLYGSLNISLSIFAFDEPFVLDYAFQILVLQLNLGDKG